jgi:hypothetical protein
MLAPFTLQVALLIPRFERFRAGSLIEPSSWRVEIYVSARSGNRIAGTAMIMNTSTCLLQNLFDLTSQRGVHATLERGSVGLKFYGVRCQVLGVRCEV